MCDEWPSIYYRQDFDQVGYDGVLEVGGREGVKFERGGGAAWLNVGL